MQLFTNPVRGLMGNVGAQMRIKAHLKRYAPRELRKTGYEVFKDMGMEEKFFKEFERAIKSGLVKEIEADEEKLLMVAGHMCDEVKEAVTDIMMIGIFQINLLKRILNDDEGIIAKGFPPEDGAKLRAKVTIKLKETMNSLHDAGNNLVNM